MRRKNRSHKFSITSQTVPVKQASLLPYWYSEQGSLQSNMSTFLMNITVGT